MGVGWVEERVGGGSAFGEDNELQPVEVGV